MLNFRRKPAAVSAAPRYPGRNGLERVTLPPQVVLIEPAKAILSEYGGLQFGDKNEFTKIDPNLPLEVIKDMEAFVGLVGRPLYPLGFREHQDREYLFVDEGGVIYILTDVLHTFACSFADALLQVMTHSSDPGVRQRLQARSLLGKTWALPTELGS